MKIALLYTAVSGGGNTATYAARFVSTHHLFPPGIDHDTIVVCNNGQLPFEVSLLFESIPNCRFFPRSNEGWDIGGYLEAARGIAADYDIICCFGESVYAHREGWLARLVEEWERYGPGMYGPFGSYVIRAHLQTTCFFTSPELLRRYPYPVRNRAERYEFEHGRRSFWRTLSLNGKPTMMITWDGCWSPSEWRFPHDIIWRGTQENCLLWANHTENFLKSPPMTRAYWQRVIDQPFK